MDPDLAESAARQRAEEGDRNLRHPDQPVAKFWGSDATRCVYSKSKLMRGGVKENQFVDDQCLEEIIGSAVRI